DDDDDGVDWEDNSAVVKRAKAASLAGGAVPDMPAFPDRLESVDEQEIAASCPICAQPFLDTVPYGKRAARVLYCGHLVCTGCVETFLKENEVTSASDRHPCVVCRRRVRWTDLPICRTVAYLYSQLKMTNDLAKPLSHLPRLRMVTRKRMLDNRASTNMMTRELAHKTRKLVTMADLAYEQHRENSDELADREFTERIENQAQAD
ncbi:hypothetical protein PFISCL1PPCAC_7661, partial [Pristionchus fissidentatus]